jgi:hypothetical protein
MKKYLLFAFSIIVFSSCEHQEIEYSNFETNPELRSKGAESACTLINSDRISGSPIYTHGSYNGNNNTISCVDIMAQDYECFVFKLKNAVETEVRTQYGPSEGDYELNEIPVTTFSTDFIYFYDIMSNTSNLHPEIDIYRANIVYRELACIIVDHINNLPQLPNGEYYGVKINSMSVDHLWNAANTLTYMTYTIFKYD